MMDCMGSEVSMEGGEGRGRWRSRLVLVGGIGGVLLVVLNVGSAFIATRPSVQVRLFGGDDGDGPRGDAMDAERVEYGPGRTAWWMPAERSSAVVVIVHGFNLSAEPIMDDPAPILPFARALRRHGYSCLLVNLGYATGAHRYTGGREEARDIDRAVAWAKAEAAGPIALWGFSDGGHHALVAAATNDDIAGVATDSAFADTGEIVQQQAALVVHLPKLLLSLVPPSFRALGGADLDVGDAWTATGKPVLVVHGTEDTAISPTEAMRLGRITGGEVWMVDGADHVDAFRVDEGRYMDRALAFLGRISRT